MHSLAHARAALEAASESGLSVTLYTAPGAAAYAGVTYLAAVVNRARQAFPSALADAVIDCGADAGTVQAALRTGWKSVLFRGRSDVADKLAAIAGQHGACLAREGQTAIDLLDQDDPLGSCRSWLSGRGTAIRQE